MKQSSHIEASYKPRSGLVHRLFARLWHSWWAGYHWHKFTSEMRSMRCDNAKADKHCMAYKRHSEEHYYLANTVITNDGRS